MNSISNYYQANTAARITGTVGLSSGVTLLALSIILATGVIAVGEFTLSATVIAAVSGGILTAISLILVTYPPKDEKSELAQASTEERESTTSKEIVSEENAQAERKANEEVEAQRGKAEAEAAKNKANAESGEVKLTPQQEKTKENLTKNFNTHSQKAQEWKKKELESNEAADRTTSIQRSMHIKAAKKSKLKYKKNQKLADECFKNLKNLGY